MLTADYVKKILTPEDIERLFVNEFHADPPTTDGSGNLLFSTEICHGGDSPKKLVYRIDKHSFYCWTHCHSIDLFEIVRRQKGFAGFKEAFDWVVAYFNIKDDGAHLQPERRTDDWELLQRLDDLSADDPEDAYVERIIPERALDSFSPPCAPYEWLRDGISPEVMVHYGIRVDSARSKIIIPHRNANGQLIGIRGRSFDPFESQYAKYAPIVLDGKPCNFPTGKYLFGLHQNKETIRRMKRVLICEGEKSVLQSASFYGVDNSYCVATCGSNVSQDQIDLLLGLGVEEVILGYDREFEGRKGAPDTVEYERKLYSVVQPMLPYFTVKIIMDYDHLTGYKDSPTDRGRAVFEALWKKKVHIPPIGSAEVKTKKKKGGK